MTTQMPVTFEGTIRALRRGGWAARGLVATSSHGQLHQTQVGPRAFATKRLCNEWLRHTARSLDIKHVRIVIGSQPTSSLDIGIGRPDKLRERK